MVAFANEINGIRGGSERALLKTVRQNDEALDSALLAPNSSIASRRKQNDVDIAARLNDHGWMKQDIRNVLQKKNHRDALLSYTDDTYFKSVLDDAGYSTLSTTDSMVVDNVDYSSDDDEDDDDLEDTGGLTIDSDTTVGANISDRDLRNVTFD